jgi:osmotically inducible lipoprotein OsmB
MATEIRKSPLSLVLALPLCLSLVACTNMSDTQQRTLTGGAIGAGTGAAITLMTGGCVACGTAIGAAAGAGAGYVYDQVQKDK